MVRSPSTKLLAAAGVVLFATVATIAGAGNTQQPGVRNGVITACIEPPTKGNQGHIRRPERVGLLEGREEDLVERPRAEGTRRSEGRAGGSRPGRRAGRPRAGRPSGPGRWAGR